MRIATWLFVALFTLALSPSAHAAPRKFALIIANSDYDGDGKVDQSETAVMRAHERGYVGDLANPWFDSVRVGQALKSAGFEVETMLNADKAMMAGASSRARRRRRACR